MIYSPEELKRRLVCRDANTNSTNSDYFALAAYKEVLSYVGNRSAKVINILQRKKEKDYGKNIKEIAYYQKTRAVIEKSLKWHCYYIKYIPHDLLTPELVLIAVKFAYLPFRCIPKHMQTSEIASECIRERKRDIKNIPHKFQTQKIVDDLVKQANIYLLVYNVMKYIANRFKTPENALIAIRVHPCNIKYIPRKLITQEIADIVTRDADYIEMLPENMINMVILKELVLMQPWKYKKLPDKITEEAYLYVIREDCSIIRWLPDHVRTQDANRKTCVKCIARPMTCSLREVDDSD